MTIHQQDREILRSLARQVRDIAALDIQNTNIANWKALYDCRPNKPMISIDQICWGEFAREEELRLRCADPFARQLEWYFRETLYRWRHFPCDMVVKPWFPLGKIFTDSGIGVSTTFQDETGHEGAQTHLFHDCIPDEDALVQLHAPVITYEREKSLAAKQKAEEYFGDILPVRLTGTLLWEALWDRIVFWRGAETILYDLYDRPEFLHSLMGKLCEFEMAAIDQYEGQNLLEGEGGFCHCIETWCNDLPKAGFDPEHTRAADCWVSGAAQIFSEVSPAMHDEFEIQYMKPIYERFGLVNYGCCEPLHHKIDIIRKIKNVRAISVSPWAKVDAAAEAMGNDFVMARKPSPSFVAFRDMDGEAIRREIRGTLDACKRNNTPVVFVLKDLTTVKNEPRRLEKWHDAVKEEIERF